MEIRKFPSQNERVETGPIQFGEDWPGFFLRGDNAFALRLAIANILVNPHDVFARMQLQAYMQELDACNLNKTVVEKLRENDGRV